MKKLIRRWIFWWGWSILINIDDIKSKVKSEAEMK